VRLHRDKNDKEMAFLTIRTEGGSESVTVFSWIWPKVRHELQEGSSGLFLLDLSGFRGSVFHALHPIELPDNYK